LLGASGLHDMNVMSVGPAAGAMKERASRVILMGHVLVAEGRERTRVRCEAPDVLDGDLSVDDRLGGQTRDGRGAVVIDPEGNAVEGRGHSSSFLFERRWPVRVVRNDSHG